MQEREIEYMSDFFTLDQARRVPPDKLAEFLTLVAATREIQEAMRVVLEDNAEAREAEQLERERCKRELNFFKQGYKIGQYMTLHYMALDEWIED